MPLAQSVTSIADALLAEFENQAPVTRKFLDRLPQDRLTWKPHEKSLTAGQLALHIALVPGNIIRLVADNPRQARGKFDYPQPAAHQEILEAFDQSISTVRSVMPGYDDNAMNETWRLVQGDRELFSAPRASILRDLMFSHWYQHRGQFSVYLRLLNVPVPASWGPSADEPPLFVQRAEANALSS
jgi:uncharacterized damage-inducible protein DinB